MQNKTNKYGQEFFPSYDYTGRFHWYSHCYTCGTRVDTNLHMRGKIYCDRCKAELRRQERESKEIDDILKYEIRFQQGVGLLESKVANIEPYLEAIDLARTKIRRYGSTDEVLAAIVLIHFGYKVLLQQKIGRYIADFVLPDEKLILEVDGKPFHSDAKKELARDNEISLRMGLGWQVVHITTDKLRKKPLALDEAIKQYKV